MTILRTERLTLRPLELADAPRLSALAGAPEVARMLARMPSPYPAIAAEGQILLTLASAKAHGQTHFAVELPGHGLIGVVAALPDDDGLELSFWIGKPFWGCGFAKEAISALIQHLDQPELVATVYNDNTACFKLLARLGFVDTGDARRGYCFARKASADYRVLKWRRSAPGLKAA